MKVTTSFELDESLIDSHVMIYSMQLLVTFSSIAMSNAALATPVAFILNLLSVQRQILEFFKMKICRRLS